MPIGSHYASLLSPDGTKLFCSIGGAGANILDLRTLTMSQYDIRPFLPKEMKFARVAPFFIWCPYDNNKFAAIARLGIDTIGDGKKYFYGEHLIICSLDGSYFKDITPDVFGKLGSQYSLDLRSWLPNSTFEIDWFLIGYQLEDYGKQYYGYYNPLTQEMIEQNNKGLVYYTKDWKYQFFANYDSTYKFKYYINDKELVFKDIDSADLGYASFSPDGKYFAIAANVYNRTRTGPYDSTDRLSEVWVVEVEKFMQNPVQPFQVKIINIKEKFCMFSYGLHPVFASNNTLAVSTFKAGDSFSYLHEIDINGNYIRQLTFVP